ncbi:methyl esterase 12 [Prunus dulcis]|uniref:Methyl esterase 12 n=1 Tax=Prunus dulcis TaxID=3755 RepID=A0A4Y1QVX2_PRUDU|nr:methyl esterase 12 [Prunus dulcis]
MDIGSRSKRVNRSQRKLLAEEEFLHRQALSMALHQHQLSQRFDGSMSRRIGSTSSRRLADPFANGKQVPESLENIKTKKLFWYMEKGLEHGVGLLPVTFDLKGSGIDLTDTNSVATLAEYSKPLIEYLENLEEDEKVILVGHSNGGACVSYALEHFSQKISKAIFICATMCLMARDQQFMQGSKFLIHGNGKDKPPTGFMFEKEQMKGYISINLRKGCCSGHGFHETYPTRPNHGKTVIVTKNYGTSRRFFIQTLDDRALSPDVQEKLVRENPPEGVFKIKGSDHCPFFSKPQSLHKMLVEIAQIP